LLRILRWIVGVPIAILVIGFAVANRQWTRLSLDPFSSDSPVLSLTMPIWLLFVFGVFIGLMVGWITCWLGQGKHRKLARERGREIVALKSELETSKAQPASEQALTPYIGLTP
jgi:uncharacterized integral membrane protein